MADEKPSPENREIAAFVRTAFGGDCRVTNFRHDSRPLSIPIISCKGRPSLEATSYSTVGLSDFIMRNGGRDADIRIEIAGACNSGDMLFPNLISTAAFTIMRSQWFCHPGAVLQDVVSAYKASTTLDHLYFTAPFLWESDLRTHQFGGKRVTWVLAMPISSAEYDYLRDYGDDAFEDLLERAEVDLFDLNRPSAID